jgi:hypothetical protein
MLKLAKIILIIALLLALSLAAGFGLLQHKLKKLPITNLAYDINQLSLNKIGFSQLSFSLVDPKVDIQLQQITLNWRWSNLLSPSLDLIDIQQGKLALQHWPKTSEQTSKSEFSLPQNWQLPAALPNQVTINNVQLQLPCAEQQCGYLVKADLSKSAQQFVYQLQLADIDSPLNHRVQLSGQLNTGYDLPELNTELNVDNAIELSLQHQFSQTANQLTVNSHIKFNAQPLSPWLQQQLSHWQVQIPKQALAQFTAPINIDSQAQLLISLPLDSQNILQQLSGHWQLSASLPTELSLPSIGLVKGDLAAQISVQQGQVVNYQLQSALELSQVKFSGALQQYGLAIDDVFIEINADGSTQPSLNALPILVKMTTVGVTQAKVNSKLIVNATDDYKVTINNAKLNLEQPKLFYSLADGKQVALSAVAISSEFNASWQAATWQLDLSSLNADIASLAYADIKAKHIKLSLQPSQFSSEQELSFNSSFKLDIASLQQPELVAQPWQYQAQVAGNINNFNLDGRIENAAHLAVAHQIRYRPDMKKVNWQLDDIFILGGNPLAASFMQWPTLLEFNRGKIMAHGSVDFSQNQAVIGASINLNELSGVYDRSIFKALTAQMALNYSTDSLYIDIAEAKLAEFSQGVELGPILLNANYKATNANLMAGIVDLQQLDIMAMGGKVTAKPSKVDLSKSQQLITLQLDKIDLAKVLQQHPTADLTGNGRISGTIPLLISQHGVSVDKGHLAAESPGGELQYRPAAASGMAAGNQSMKVVLDALDNFHYSVLSSNVSYDTNGKLNLALSIQGQNPKLEKGRAINFNINLEEDLPALITSMQLSSQISEKIKRRVQQRLQQKAAKASNGESP